MTQWSSRERDKWRTQAHNSVDDAARARERVLLDTMAAEPKDSPAYSRARDELVTIHLPLVEHLARRFRDRGEPHDDLVQVGNHRFDQGGRSI